MANLRSPWTTLLTLGALGILGAHAAPAHAEAPRKGFVELGLGYGYALSNADFLEVDTGTNLDPPHASGAALDVAAGYALAPGFALVGGFQRTWATTIKGLDQDGDEQEYSWGYWNFTVGARAVTPLGPGAFYAQLALGVVLPFETERFEWRNNNETRETTIGYNSGFGAASEAGYQYPLNPRMYLAGGLRLQAYSTDNVGRERIRVDQPSGDVDRTTYSRDPDAPNADRAEALSVQDLRLRVGFGLRF